MLLSGLRCTPDLLAFWASRPHTIVVPVVTPLWLAPVVDVADDHRMHLASALWIGIGAIALAIGAILLFFRGSSEDLGAVSAQWVVRHRAGRLDDLDR